MNSATWRLFKAEQHPRLPSEQGDHTRKKNPMQRQQQGDPALHNKTAAVQSLKKGPYKLAAVTREVELSRRLTVSFTAAWLAISMPAIALSGVPQTMSPQESTTQSDEHPSMPDGLYLLQADSSVILFLLVDKGQWIDPYTQAQRRGIEELNALFLRGQTLQAFHVYTKRWNMEGVALNKFSVEQLLAHDAFTPYASVDRTKLLPYFSTQRCDFLRPEHRWQCMSNPVSITRVPGQNCDAKSDQPSCGASIITSQKAYSQLTANHGDQGLLKIATTPFRRQISEEFKTLGLPVARDVFRINVKFSDALYGPDGQGLLSGKFALDYKSKGGRGSSSVESPASTVELGFIWDIAHARFSYLQREPVVVNEALMQACKQRAKLRACPEVEPLAMWAIRDKLYVVWRYSQAMGVRAFIHPPSAGVYQYEPRDSVAFPEMGRLAIVELQPHTGQMKEIFSTGEFFFVRPF